MLEDGWSPDTVVGFANRYNLFANELIPCTTTLYHWIDSGIMRTKNIDLLENLLVRLRTLVKKFVVICECLEPPFKNALNQLILEKHLVIGESTQL